MTVGKIVATAVIVILAIPGLVIEPGPFSEVAAGMAVLSVWGYSDVLGGEQS
jgi:hypothetical protein